MIQKPRAGAGAGGIPPVLSVAAGSLLLLTGAVVVGMPAVRFVKGGPVASFVVVGSYLALVILAALGVLAGVASWIHDRSLFTSISVAMWSLTVLALFIEPVPVFSFAVLAAISTVLFHAAEAAGATGLAFSFGKVEPTWIPPADYRPGHDLSRTRSGIIEAHRRQHGGWETDPDATSHHGTETDQEPEQGSRSD